MEDIDGTKKKMAKVNSCDHTFCSQCIKEWSKTRVVCPNCKKGFYKVITFQTPKKQVPTYVEKKMIIAELHKVLKEAARGIFVGLNLDPQESLRVEL